MRGSREERWLVFGGSGQLGTALARELAAGDAVVHAPSRAEADLTGDDLGSVFEATSPTAVINAAAYNDVDGAESESNRELACGLNRDAPARLARLCAERELALVHVSTDYVFNGRADRPYREDDPVDPLQFYGRSKLSGERIVLETHPRAVVARTSTLYGDDRRGGSNYVTAILRQARRAGVLEVTELPVASPTYARDLARALLTLVARGASGLVHVANDGGCSRLELATEALRLAGLTDRVELRTRPATCGAAARPAYSMLDSSRFARLAGRPMAAWRDALRDFLGSP